MLNDNKEIGYLSDCYFSKFDDSYITDVGREKDVEFLAELEITEQLTHGVGFSPKDNKWYGWSHRVIYGFEIGSKCKKGHCHYVASTPEELIDDHANFFSESGKDKVKYKRHECQILDDRSGIRVLTGSLKIPVTTYEIKCGRGEWVAKTMADAKQMAIDFKEGVS